MGELGKRTRADLAGGDSDSDSDIEILSAPPPALVSATLPARKRQALRRACNAKQTTSVNRSPASAALPLRSKATKQAVSGAAKMKGADNVMELEIEGRSLRPTPVFDRFWRYAAERQSIELKRRSGAPAP